MVALQKNEVRSFSCLTAGETTGLIGPEDSYPRVSFEWLPFFCVLEGEQFIAAVPLVGSNIHGISRVARGFGGEQEERADLHRFRGSLHSAICPLREPWNQSSLLQATSEKMVSSLLVIEIRLQQQCLHLLAWFLQGHLGSLKIPDV